MPQVNFGWKQQKRGLQLLVRLLTIRNKWHDNGFARPTKQGKVENINQMMYILGDEGFPRTEYYACQIDNYEQAVNEMSHANDYSAAKLVTMAQTLVQMGDKADVHLIERYLKQGYRSTYNDWISK